MKLKHPNIIHIMNAWINKAKDELVYITELVAGGSLKKYVALDYGVFNSGRYLRKFTPRMKVIKGWSRAILSGLEYLHSQQPSPIIHREIKCDNIFIECNKGDIRIGDLGLATYLRKSLTSSVIMSPEFMAPEMFDEHYTELVDVYAFGMTLLEICTGQSPYRECKNAAQVYKRVLNRVKPACLEMIQNTELKHFISMCIEDSKDRPTASELLAHEFLNTFDTDADNQPISLLDIMTHEPMVQSPSVNEREEPENKFDKRQSENVLHTLRAQDKLLFDSQESFKMASSGYNGITNHERKLDEPWYIVEKPKTIQLESIGQVDASPLEESKSKVSPNKSHTSSEEDSQKASQ